MNKIIAVFGIAFLCFVFNPIGIEAQQNDVSGQDGNLTYVMTTRVVQEQYRVESSETTYTINKVSNGEGGTDKEVYYFFSRYSEDYGRIEQISKQVQRGNDVYYLESTDCLRVRYEDVVEAIAIISHQNVVPVNVGGDSDAS